jgi:hypothetical protein
MGKSKIDDSRGLGRRRGKKVKLAPGSGANGAVLEDLKNSANTSVSGTVKTVEIDIGGTSYYFLVSPTSSA